MAGRQRFLIDEPEYSKFADEDIVFDDEDPPSINCDDEFPEEEVEYLEEMDGDPAYEPDFDY